MTWRRVIAAAVLLTVFMLTVFAAQGRDHRIHYVGVPDGAAGCIARYVAGEKMGKSAIRTIRFEPYTLYDCCASASQVALGSGRLDMAVLCPEAALALVQKDPRYVIAGPVIFNADVLVMRPQATGGETTVAVSQKRNQQRRLVRCRLGRRGRPVPMLHSAIPFAYARGVVQGAVVDIVKALRLPGTMPPPHHAEKEKATYVLVVRKAIQDSPHYRRFMARYDQAVRETQNRDVLLHLLKTCINTDMTMGDVETWQKMNVRFASPSSNHRPG